MILRIPENFGDVATGRTRPNTSTGRFLLDRKVNFWLQSGFPGYRTGSPRRNSNTLRPRMTQCVALQTITAQVISGSTRGNVVGADFDELVALMLMGPFHRWRSSGDILFLRGSKDGTRAKAGVSGTRRLYPVVKIITYEDAAHWLMIERKETVTRDVLDWLYDVGL